MMKSQTKFLLLAALAAGMAAQADTTDYVYSFRVVKIWEDYADRNNLRPSSVEFKLASEFFSTNFTVACTPGTNVSETTISGLPAWHDVDGRPDNIVYELLEQNLPEWYRADVVQPKLSVDLKVNNGGMAKIGPGENLDFKATVTGSVLSFNTQEETPSPLAGPVVWSYVDENGPHEITSPLEDCSNGSGTARLSFTYEDLKNILNSGKDYVMTASYQEGFLEKSAQVRFGVLGDNPDVIFVEPAYETTLATYESFRIQANVIMGSGNSANLKWTVSNSSALAPGYTAPADNTTDCALSFSKPGDYTIKATATDDNDNSGSSSIIAHVEAHPTTEVLLVVTNTLGAVVKGVKARQRWPWNGLVDIDYEVVGEMPGLAAAIDVAVKPADGEAPGAARSWAAKTFVGEGPSAAHGRHRVVWDAKADGATNVNESVRATVKLLNMGSDSSEGDFSAYLAVKSNSQVFLSTEASVAEFLSNSFSRVSSGETETIEFPNVSAFFKHDENGGEGAALDNEGIAVLAKFGSSLAKANGEADVLVEGYTCDLGSVAEDDELSQLRAEAVKVELANYYPASKITAKWYGKRMFKKFKYDTKAEYDRVNVRVQ